MSLVVSGCFADTTRWRTHSYAPYPLSCPSIFPKANRCACPSICPLTPPSQSCSLVSQVSLSLQTVSLASPCALPRSQPLSNSKASWRFPRGLPPPPPPPNSSSSSTTTTTSFYLQRPPLVRRRSVAELGHRVRHHLEANVQIRDDALGVTVDGLPCMGYGRTPSSPP